MIPQQLHRENGPYGSLLVASCPPGSRLIDYQLELLMRHKPAWLLACYVRYRHGSAQICLDTSGKRPLDEAYADLGRDPASGYKLLGDIARLLCLAQDLLLPAEQFSLHPSLIYLDQTATIQLAFWPCQIKESPGEELAELCSSIGSAFAWKEEEVRQVRAAAEKGSDQLADWLERSDKKPLANTVEKTKTAPSKGKKSPRTKLLLSRPSLLNVGGLVLHLAFAAWTGLVVLIGMGQKSRPFLLPALCCLAGLDLYFWLASFRKNAATGAKQPPAGKKKSLVAAWQKLLGSLAAKEGAAEPDQTVLLTQADDFRMAMLSQGQPGSAAEHEGIRAFILVDEFIIGRDAQKADLCLNQQAVGRLHARIQRRAGSFFIRDLGSGNGTELDGQRLPRHEDQLLPDSCLLSFAGQEFYFTAD